MITYFVTRVTGELNHRNDELRAAEQRRAQSEKLESLGTLAAGAAHELASPLSTIAVVAKELERRLQDSPEQATLLSDARLIRSELDHCRAILDRMAGHAGQAVGEQVTAVPVAKFLDDVIGGVRRQDRVRRRVDDDVGEVEIAIPRESLAQAVRGLVQNALDATDPEGEVDVQAARAESRLLISVVDHGPGMDPETLARVGEPFYTTKEPGKGMGLGVFLARSVIERLGGTVRLETTPGGGVTARVHLPLPPLQAPDRVEPHKADVDASA